MLFTRLITARCPAPGGICPKAVIILKLNFLKRAIAARFGPLNTAFCCLPWVESLDFGLRVGKNRNPALLRKRQPPEKQTGWNLAIPDSTFPVKYSFAAVFHTR